MEPIPIQLRCFHQFQFAGYYTAIEKGFYADEGLQVSLREVEPGKNRIAPVLEGKAQYGVGGPGLLKVRIEGEPVVVTLAITREGLPVRCWVFPGNTTDSKTVQQVRSDLGLASIKERARLIIGRGKCHAQN